MRPTQKLKIVEKLRRS